MILHQPSNLSGGCKVVLLAARDGYEDNQSYTEEEREKGALRTLLAGLISHARMMISGGTSCGWAAACWEFCWGVERINVLRMLRTTALEAWPYTARSFGKWSVGSIEE